MTCLTLVCEARLPKHSAVTALLILRADTKGFSLLCSSFVEGKSFPSVSDLFKEKRDKCKPVQLVDTKAEERKEFAKSFVYAAEEGPEIYLHCLSVFVFTK